MATWSDVELLVNEDTNSARLYGVSTEESGSGLYQVDTLVKISSADEVPADPRLLSFGGLNWSIVVVDKTVILFDQSYQTVLLLFHFGTDVDAIDVCLGGTFLVVCERNGNLHLIYVPQKRILFTRTLVDKPSSNDEKTYRSIIISEDKSSVGMYHVFLLIKDGFFHISNLTLTKIQAACENMDVGAFKELQSLIKVDFISTEDYHDEGCSTAVIFSLGHELNLLIGGGKDIVVTRWKMDPLEGKMCFSQSIDNSLIPGVRKMVVVENLLYILDSEDVLSVWYLHFLVMIHSWPDLSFHDFELTTECGSASIQDQSSMKIITLTKQKSGQINSLQIRCLPSMSVCYSLDISSVSCLVQMKTNMDAIYLVEAICENPESQGEPVATVVVRCFTEALPENRLSRLLYKHMFEEAEKFAIAFELDLELVYKVKLDFVLEQLASASVGGYGPDVWSELIEEAKTNLVKIADEQYVVDYCLKAPWPTFETAEKMLNHAASRYSCLQVHEALARLATFCSLHGSENFNGIAWIEFLNCTDNLGEVLTHLREGDMRGAQLLWMRYEGQIALEFDEKCLEAVLSAIPEDLPSQNLCPWFRTVFVPFVRRVFPRGQRILAKWLEHKARNLEFTEKGSWPQNGLNLAMLGLPSLWTWMKSVDDNDGANELESLKSLVSNLRQLLDLHQKYNCRLPLSVFEKGSELSVAFFLLDKVPAPELIAATVENSVRPYAEEYKLPLDELLLQYIKDLLERCISQTMSLFIEAKAVAVIGCMTDTDLKVDAVLEIMQKAVVSWSNVVEKLVQEYLEMDGPKQELLKESYHLMEIRKLLRGYGIHNFNLSNSTQVMSLIRYILNQDLPMSLEDSLTLAEAYNLPTAQINYLYLIQLISHGRTEEVLTVLKKLSSEEAVCVIERLTSWARLQLEDKVHISDEHKKHQMTVAQVIVEALKHLHLILKHDALKSMECEYNLIMFKAIAHLQEDFDVFFTPSNYEDPNIRKQIQEHHITAYENTRARHSSRGKASSAPIVANDPDGKTKTISTEAGLRRLGRQLQRTEQELWSDLGLRALRVGKVEKALKILSELYEYHYNSNTGKVLFTAARTLCQMLQANVPMVIPEGMDLPAVIHDLACQAITLCNSDLLLDCLELCKCTRIAMDVYHQCQLSDDYGFLAKDSSLEAEKDAYSQCSFQDVFNEDCIVLDPMAVLPVQYEITNCLLPIPQDTKLFPLDCSCLSHCSFVDGSNHLQTLQEPLTSMLQMLQECSQLELTLRVLVNSYGSCLKHVTSNIMDTKLSVQLFDSKELMKYNMCLSGVRKATLSTLNAVAVGLLNKVFSWRVVDCDFAIGLCTLLPNAEVFKILWKIIDNTWQNYDKILAVARIGANLCSLYNEPEQQKKFLSVITDAEWGVKLGKLEISIQPVFRQRPEVKSCLIPEMVKNKMITLDIILQYCSTFGLNRDSVINQYITTLLLLQEDEDSSGVTGSGPQDDGQTLCNEEVLERVLQIIPMLTSPSELVDSLCTAMFKLSPYNYERIEVVLKIIKAADENVTAFSLSQAMGLLQHLKSYKRVSPPSDVENTYLLENGLLPNPLSNSRLPFHLLIETKHFWKIISPELSEETFPTLLLISKLMKVSLDKLHMSAANHVFEKKLRPLILKQRKKGQGYSHSKEALKVAVNMMKYIQCIQNLEWATATAHKITQELPPGLEKIRSLRFCLDLGELWLKDPTLEEASRARGESFLSKLKLQFQRSATENTLISSKLSSPELMKLTGLPARLIMALYEHSSVEQRYRDAEGHTFPDIHAAVREIAKINNVDLVKIRTMLLEKWICKTGPAVTKEMGNQDCVTNIEEDPDLMRVVYILQSHSVDDAIRLLIPILSAETWPLSSSGPRLTFCHRTRVLLCLIRLADAATVEAQLQIPRSKHEYYLKSYIFVSQLEALNIPYTVQAFISSPKEGLIKGLWKNHSHEPQAVRLVADLCLEYQVYDPQLWNSLLQKLLGFNLISHLQKVLEAAVAVPTLWEISSFSRTWRSAILTPFVSASVPLSPDQQAMLYRSFVLLLKCPFLLNLDLMGIANRFVQFNLPAFALGTLLLITCPTKKAQQIQDFLSMCNPVAVLEQVDEFMSTGELAGMPSQIRETVFKFISQNGQHQKLLKTKYFDRLKQLVVSSGKPEQVKELVDCLISQNCQDDADLLTREYLKHREQQRGKTLPNGSHSEGCLKEFVNMTNGVCG
ncbi:PREDICTED: kinetochore-associated protein 1 [Cyprinodon variegatus]|uniref:kinetochore-associated protein 1 n=1 Tax=Cyprinodon variegatus TaxID=28743 RepID=UPI000742C6D8|nr:PREDICTED: kinetochore-associated protein 1 [Cyprinodon variegatus]